MLNTIRIKDDSNTYTAAELLDDPLTIHAIVSRASLSTYCALRVLGFSTREAACTVDELSGHPDAVEALMAGFELTTQFAGMVEDVIAAVGAKNILKEQTRVRDRIAHACTESLLMLNTKCRLDAGEQSTFQKARSDKALAALRSLKFTQFEQGRIERARVGSCRPNFD
ncbi:hypothetical protein P3T43_001782 [Paraburkholderia sp. GAS41]|uniref:hypothetical protein n=1 Tax=Paraburkholderia sp. GAS41 TaxID=3035134 RepID=UPI003D198169